MIKHFWIKFLATAPICFITLKQADIDLLYGIFFIVVLDTILGLWKGLKTKSFTSNKMSRLADKVGKYSIAMGSVWIVSRLETTLAWSFHYMGIYIILTELISNLENLSKLGFKIPNKLIAKVNREYNKFIDKKEKI